MTGLASAFDDRALDNLVSRAETLLVYPRPDVEVLAFNLAAAIRQLRAEVTMLRRDLQIANALNDDLPIPELH